MHSPREATELFLPFLEANGFAVRVEETNEVYADADTMAGVDLGAMSRRQRVHYQRHVVGFVWQQTSRNLMPFLTAAENIALPLTLAPP